MDFEQWASDWNIPREAFDDLKKRMLCPDVIETAVRVTHGNITTEAAIQTLVRLEASRKGCRIWRNNVGATYTPEGSFVRYGLANESSAINTKLKSADLIGIKPIKITPLDVGRTIGQFLSREIKRPGWTYRNSKQEKAQLAWIMLINGLGGDAAFATADNTI